MSVASAIDNYLQNGGLFNPEMMDHSKVRDLLIEARDALADSESVELKRFIIARQLADDTLKPWIEELIECKWPCDEFRAAMKKWLEAQKAT